jgi:hypothetical protein
MVSVSVTTGAPIMRLNPHQDNHLRSPFAVFFQLAVARFRELLPGLGHLLKVLPVRGRGGARHIPAFCSVLKVFVQFLQVEYPPVG